MAEGEHLPKSGQNEASQGREEGHEPRTLPGLPQPETAENAGWMSIRPPRAIDCVSGAAHRDDEAPYGTSQLPADLTEEQLSAAPVLDSVDSSLIEDLTDEDEDALAAAVES